MEVLLVSKNMEILRNLIGGSQFTDRTSEEFQKAMAQVFAPDIEVHEPECLPYGGVHRGRDNWLNVRRTMMSLWDQKLDVMHMWEIPEDEVIVMNYMMEWTARSTGRTFRQPAIEVLTFKDGHIVKVEFYPQDAKAMVDTLQ
jgi:ketosteroid isomerase-like protein